MRFDPKTRRYISDNGHALTPAQVRKEVMDYITGEKEKTQNEAQKLIEGKTTLTSFFQRLKSRVVLWHDIAGSIAYGGKAQLDPERRSRIQARTDSELEFLRGFQKQAKASFDAARKIAADVSKQLEAEPIKSFSGKLTVSIRAKAEKHVFESLVDANPSDAEAVTRKAVNEVLEGIETQLIAESLTIDSDTAADLMGATIPSRAGMYADAAYSTFQNNEAAREIESGVTIGRRVCAEDTASCESCVDAADTFFAPLDNLPEIGSLDCMNNCVLAGTIASGRFNGGLKALYSGEIVNLRTASGKSLSITPNHPVLTDRGFVYAGQLDEGGYLISERADIEPRTALNNHEQPPSPIEKIFAAFSKTIVPREVGRGIVDLNGDERFLDGDVQVVASHWILRDRAIASGTQRLNGISFPFSSHGQGSATTNGMEMLPIFAQRLASDGLPCSSGLNISGFNALLPRKTLSLATVADVNTARTEGVSKRSSAYSGSLTQRKQALARSIQGGGFINTNSINDSLRSVEPPESQSFGSAAHMNVALDKPAAKDPGSDAKFLSELWIRFPAFITRDPIVEITRQRVIGQHVYDLSTEVGWFTANGIIIANCRCYFEYAEPDALTLNAQPLVDRLSADMVQ